MKTSTKQVLPNIRNKGLFSNAGVVSNEETIIIGTDSNISIVFEYKIA